MALLRGGTKKKTETITDMPNTTYLNNITIEETVLEIISPDIRSYVLEL